MRWAWIEHATFRSSVWRSPNWAIPAFELKFLFNCLLQIYCIIALEEDAQPRWGWVRAEKNAVKQANWWSVNQNEGLKYLLHLLFTSITHTHWTSLFQGLNFTGEIVCFIFYWIFLYLIKNVFMTFIPIIEKWNTILK